MGMEEGKEQSSETMKKISKAVIVDYKANNGTHEVAVIGTFDKDDAIQCVKKKFPGSHQHKARVVKSGAILRMELFDVRTLLQDVIHEGAPGAQLDGPEGEFNLSEGADLEKELAAASVDDAVARLSQARGGAVSTLICVANGSIHSIQLTDHLTLPSAVRERRDTMSRSGYLYQVNDPTTGEALDPIDQFTGANEERTSPALPGMHRVEGSSLPAAKILLEYVLVVATLGTGGAYHELTAEQVDEFVRTEERMKQEEAERQQQASKAHQIYDTKSNRVGEFLREMGDNVVYRSVDDGQVYSVPKSQVNVVHT